MSADLYSIEHAQHLHDIYAPPGCPLCPLQPEGSTPPPPQTPAPAATAPAPRQKRSADGHLGTAIARVVSRMVVDEPDEPDTGPLTADGNPWCDRCHGARQLAVRTPRQPTTYTRCPECATAPWRIQQQIDRLLGTLPVRFVDWRLSTFPDHVSTQHAVLQTMLDWLEDTSPSSAYLWGPSGRGKTGLAVGLLYELASRGLSTAFTVAPDLMSLIKSSFGSEEGESDILEALTAADVLCLDDLGAEYHRGPEDWAAEKLFQVINSRHSSRKRTIFTSNCSLTQLQEKLGHPRTTRRIHEMTGTRWMVNFTNLPYLEDRQ